MMQVLHIANGETVNEKLKSKEGRLTKLLASKQSSAEIVEEAFLLALARHPTESEKQKIVAALDESPATDADQKRQLLEDVFWSVLSTREFLFNH